MPVSAEQWRVSVGLANASRSLRPQVTSQSKRKLTPWDILLFFFTALLGAILFPSMMPVSSKKWHAGIGLASQPLWSHGTHQPVRRWTSWDVAFPTLQDGMLLSGEDRRGKRQRKRIPRGRGTVGDLAPSLLTALRRKLLLIIAGDVETNPGPDLPTLTECIRFQGRERRINIPQEIGVKYRDFGLLLLEDHNGARICALALKHNNDAKEINTEIIEEWVAGKGKHPVTWKTLTQVLHDIELSPLASEIEASKYQESTEEIEAENDMPPNQADVRQILEEALEKGYVDCHIWKVLVTGTAGSGKTSLKHRLFGEEPPSLRCSTALAEAAIRAISREIVGTSVNGWLRVTYEELMELLGGALKAGIPMERSAFGKAKMGVHRQPQKGVSFSKQELVQIIEKSKGSKRFLELQWIRFIDSGGQSQFHEVLPAFIRNTTATIFVTKLSERLDEHPLIEYFDRSGELCGKPYRHALSNDQMLQCCIQTIHSQPSTRDGKHSKTLIVGTHRDIENACSESRAEKNRKLIDMLTPPLQDHLVFYHPFSEVIFPINAKTPIEEDHQVCAMIRKQIEKNTPPPYKIPIGWFLLEQDIIKASKGGVISKKQCTNIASILNIDAEALTAALQYFDDLNIFLYYPSVLPEVVFSNPQILLNKVTELVHFRYSLRSDGPPLVVEGKWLQFRDKGIVTTDMFQDERFSAHYIPGLFETEDLIKLFKHLLIVAPLSSTEYFMPSLLRMISSEEVNKHLPPPSSSAAPLLVHFPAGCAQNGVFCALVVYLLSKCQWKFAHDVRGNPICVSCDCIRFQFPGKPASIVLVDSFSYFEVHIETRDTLYPKVCPRIRNSIFSGLKVAAETLRYTNSTPVPAFFCKCSSPPHAATPVIDDDDQYLICTKSTNFIPLTKQHCAWLDIRLPAAEGDDDDSKTVYPPKITQHPENQSAAFGMNVEFSIDATGDNLQFQWQKDGSDLNSDSDKYWGVNTDTLYIVATEGSDEGDYRCLVENDVGKRFSNTALLSFDNYYLSVCEQAMLESGVTDQTIMHCIFVGPAGVGKSTLLKRLLRMKLDQTRTSTPVAETPVRVDFVRKMSTTVAWASGFDWKIIENPKAQASALIAQLSAESEKVSTKDNHSTQQKSLLNLPPQKRDDSLNTLSSAEAPNTSQNITSPPEAPSNTQTTYLPAEGANKIQVTDSIAGPISADSEASQLSKTIDFFRNVLKEKGASRVHIRNPCTLYLTDSGGQPEFQELLPALVVGPCIFIIVFPLHKDLNTKYEVEYERPDEGKKIKKYTSSLTIKEDILQSLASIACTKFMNRYGRKLKPRVMFVATFKDEVPQKKDRQRVLKDLQVLVENTDVYRDGIIVDASETQMVFTINNISDDEAEEDAKQIRNAFEKITGYFKISTPSSWLIFSILVQHVYGKDHDEQHEHGKHSVISYDECFKLAQECGINSDAFEAALHFLHKQTGVLYYYKQPSELRQIVICNPQHILSEVNKLVERTFDFKQTQCAQCTKDFNRGIFKRLDYEMQTKDSSNSLLTPSMFLKLLEHLKVVVPLRDGEKYFMPCAITYIDEVNSSHSMQSSIVPPLLITFESGYCPKGLFGALVACIANKEVSNCMITLEESKIHRDQICFKLGRHTLLLRTNPAYVYVEVTPYSTDNSLSTELCMLCNSVRTFIEGNITKACKTLCYSDSAKYRLSFVCQCSQKERFHPSELRKDTDGKYFLWCKRSEECVRVKSECYIWLHEPHILKHPKDISVAPGAVAEFQVKATGDALQFQWQKNRKEILSDGDRYCDTDTDTLRIEEVEESDKGRYRCIVTTKNGAGKEVSDEAHLTINDQPTPTEPVRFRERDRRLNMAPVKHQPSDDFSLDPKTVKQARASSPEPSVKRHMSPKDGGSGQGREREADLSAVSRSYDLEVASHLPTHESKGGQKRSLSGSYESDDSLSPPSVKKKQQHKKRRHSSPSPEQTRGASSMLQKPDDNREQNVADQISDLEIGPTTKRRTGILQASAGFTTANMNSMKPTLAQLKILKTTTGEKIKIIESVAPKWKELGDLLDFDPEGRTLELIEANNQQKGHVACCREMFVYWLRGKGREATWGVLIELLDDIDQSELAKKVETALHLSL